MTSTPEFDQGQDESQPVQAPESPTRAQRLTTYSAKVRKLRVAILSVGIGSVVSWLVTVILTDLYVTPCIHLSRSCSINSDSDLILGGFFMLLVMPALGLTSLSLSLALLVLGIVLIVERKRSQGTWPAIVAIVIGALQPLVAWATLAEPLMILATLANLVFNHHS